MLVRSVEDVDRYLGKVRQAALNVQAWVAAQNGDLIAFLRRMKFDQVGFRPIEHWPLNMVEQINQTWTYTVALAAARQLLETVSGPLRQPAKNR